MLEHALESLAASEGRASADLLVRNPPWIRSGTTSSPLARSWPSRAEAGGCIKAIWRWLLSRPRCGAPVSREQGVDAARGILAEAEQGVRRPFRRAARQPHRCPLLTSDWPIPAGAGRGGAQARQPGARGRPAYRPRRHRYNVARGHQPRRTAQGRSRGRRTTWARRDRHRAPARQRLADDLGARGRRARRLLGWRQRPGARQCTRDGDPRGTNPPVPFRTGDGAACRCRIRRRRRRVGPRQAHRARRRARPSSSRPQCRPRVGATDPLAAGAGPNTPCEQAVACVSSRAHSAGLPRADRHFAPRPGRFVSPPEGLTARPSFWRRPSGSLTRPATRC